MAHDYIQARKSHLNYYQAVPLFYQNNNGKFVLYKTAGVKLADIRMEAKSGEILPQIVNRIKAIHR